MLAINKENHEARINRHSARLRHFSSFMAIGLFCSNAWVSASAQQVDDEDQGNRSYTIEEVVVTAQKREQNAQEVPITINAFSKAELDRRGFEDISDIAQITPNLQIDTTSPFSGASSSLVAFIRGIGQSDFALNFDPGVGLYVDGVYYARSLGAVLDLLDVERIEVLKGPQGTLFGRNTIGGAISVTTKAPDNEFSGAVDVTGGRFNKLNVRGNVNIPLVQDKLFASLSFSSKNQDGFQERIPFTGEGADDVRPIQDSLAVQQNVIDPGNENNFSVRSKIEWHASDTLKVTLGGDYSRIRENAPPTTLLDTFSSPFNAVPDSNVRSTSPNLPGPPALGPLADVFNACASGTTNNIPIPPFLCVIDGPLVNTPVNLFGVNTDDNPNNDVTLFDDRFITDDIDQSFANGISFSDIDTYGVSLTLDYDLTADIALKSISAYRGARSIIGTDIDGSPLTINEPSFDQDQEQFTQELQLNGQSFDARLQWLLGAYYFRETGAPVTNAIFGGGLVQFFSVNPQVNESYAAFGQATYDLTEKLSVTGGIRVTRENKSVDPFIQDLNALFDGILPTPEADPTIQVPLGETSLSFTDVSPKASIEYRATDNLFLFANYARGFKSGGFDLRPTAPLLEVPTFDEEIANSFEVGFKSDLFDRRLRFNATGYLVFYDDIQQSIQVFISPFTENVASARLSGVEVDFQALLTPNLVLSGAAGFFDGEFTDVEPGTVGITEDSEFQNTAKFNSTLALDYTMTLANQGRVDFHIDWNYRSQVFNNAENSALLLQPARSIFNVNTRYTEPSERWYVNAGIKNLTDKREITSGFDQIGIGFVQANFNRPLEWFVGLGYNF